MIKKTFSRVLIQRADHGLVFLPLNDTPTLHLHRRLSVPLAVIIAKYSDNIILAPLFAETHYGASNVAAQGLHYTFCHVSEFSLEVVPELFARIHHLHLATIRLMNTINVSTDTRKPITAECRYLGIDGAPPIEFIIQCFSQFCIAQAVKKLQKYLKNFKTEQNPERECLEDRFFSLLSCNLE